MQAITLAAVFFAVCLLLVLSSQGQLGDANSEGGATPPNGDTAALLAASNALEAAYIVILTNELDQALPATAAPAMASPAMGFAEGTVATDVQSVITNLAQAVTYIQLQSQPSALSGLMADMQQGMMVQSLSSTPTCIRPGSGLVSWWRGEGNTLDYIGNNPGTPENGLGSGVGEVGQAFSFINGYNQWVEVPYATNLASPSFTYEAWVYPNSSLSGQVFLYGQSCGRQFDLEPAGSGYCYLAIFITDAAGHFKTLSSSARLPVGAWSHVASTYDGTTLKLYINGALNAQSTPGISTIGDSHCPFSIGGGGSCGPRAVLSRSS